LTISPPRYHLPSLLCHIKEVGSLIIRRHIHSPPFFGFLLCKNSFSRELKSLPLPLLTVRPHPSLYHPELRPVRSPEGPPSSPSIHGKLLYITTTVYSNCGEFLPSQVHYALNASHGLQSLHLVHIISRTKINPNSRDKSRTLHQHMYLFEKLCSNP
jgi:hypothetical protein